MHVDIHPLEQQINSVLSSEHCDNDLIRVFKWLWPTTPRHIQSTLK